MEDELCFGGEMECETENAYYETVRKRKKE